MKRYRYNLTHQVASAGSLGQLIPFCIMEVAPGDTFSGKVGMLVRFSPLKKALLMDIDVDLFMTYTPHRLVDSGWEDFVANGPVAAGTTVPSITLAAAGADDMPHLRYVNRAGSTRSQSAYRLYCYNLIYNEYFRDDDDTPVANTDRNSGLPWSVNAKKNFYTTLSENLGESESHIVDVQSGTPDFVRAEDILQAVAQQKVAMKRATYGTRYVDILKSMGININYQMLQRPEIVGVGRSTVNVTDVVSTNDASTLGELAGHGISGVRLTVKRKSFPEHGTLMGVMVARPKYTFEGINDWFDTPRDYTSYYDPGFHPLPPVDVQLGDVMTDTISSGSAGHTPWGEWYRRATNWMGPTEVSDFVAKHYQAADTTISRTDLRQISPSTYADIFENTTKGQIQFSAVNKLSALRLIPRKSGVVFPGST